MQIGLHLLLYAVAALGVRVAVAVQLDAQAEQELLDAELVEVDRILFLAYIYIVICTSTINELE